MFGAKFMSTNGLIIGKGETIVVVVVFVIVVVCPTTK